jgi:CMP/dCMP kinase
MPVIAISGQPGCGSSTTAQMLSDRLNLKFFSLGKWNKEQLHIIEGRETGSETKNSIEMWQNKKGSSKGFHHESDMMQKEIAAKGNVVIDSKLAIHMLKDLADLKIWLKVDFKVRAKRVAKRDGVSQKIAAEMLGEKERLERDSWKKIYGFDYFEEEKEADLVIDVADKEPGVILDIIMTVLHEKNLAKDKRRLQ